MSTSNEQANIVTHREMLSNKTAVVFIHGFSGDPHKTWQAFPSLLTPDPRLNGWDVHSVGYSSKFWLDLVGIWKADPPIISLADGLRTAATLPPFNRYTSFVLVAHSMGGLVVQRAIADDPKFTDRLSHVFLFGTPSGGLVKAAFFKFWKPASRAAMLLGDRIAAQRLEDLFLGKAA